MTTKPKTTTRKTTVKKTTSPRKAAPKATLELPPNPFTFEVFALVNKQKTKAKKVEVLRKYEHYSFGTLTQV